MYIPKSNLKITEVLKTVQELNKRPRNSAPKILSDYVRKTPYTEKELASDKPKPAPIKTTPVALTPVSIKGKDAPKIPASKRVLKEVEFVKPREANRKFATEHTASAHRLRKGMRVMFGGRECTVVMVNDSRAVIRPNTRKDVSFTPKTGSKADEPVNFLQPEREISISPNSEIEIL